MSTYKSLKSELEQLLGKFEKALKKYQANEEVSIEQFRLSQIEPTKEKVP